MKSIQRIGNVTLALLLLISSTGVTMSKHYCMGRLKSVTVFEKSASCASESEAAAYLKMCCDESSPKTECCKTVQEELKVDNHTNVSFEYNFSTDLGSIIVSGPLSDLKIASNFDNTPYQYYKPPLIERDIPVLIQSFLL